MQVLLIHIDHTQSCQIREYLAFNGYEHSLSVFLSETAQPETPVMDREFLKSELGIAESGNIDQDCELPLLMSVVKGYSRAREMQEQLLPLVRRKGGLKQPSHSPLGKGGRGTSQQTAPLDDPTNIMIHEPGSSKRQLLDSQDYSSD